MRIANILGLAILSAVSLLACSDDSPQPGSEFTFNMSTLECPSDSLDITDHAGPFPSDSVVTFMMGDQKFDGSAVVLGNGVIDCGLPAGAPPGMYSVTVTEPGGTPFPVGNVTLKATDCP